MNLERSTNETTVSVHLELTPGPATSDTRIRFLDHMLLTLASYAEWTMAIRARGDLPHHTIEDVAIALGSAVLTSQPAALERFGHRGIAMDDALVTATVDVGGRPYYEGPLPSTLYDHFFRSFSVHARMTLQLEVRRGRDRHHVVEAAFKAVGLALRDALRPRADLVSTKGAVRVTEPAETK